MRCKGSWAGLGTLVQMRRGESDTSDPSVDLGLISWITWEGNMNPG